MYIYFNKKKYTCITKFNAGNFFFSILRTGSVFWILSPTVSQIIGSKIRLRSKRVDFLLQKKIWEKGRSVKYCFDSRIGESLSPNGYDRIKLLKSVFFRNDNRSIISCWIIVYNHRKILYNLLKGENFFGYFI